MIMRKWKEAASRSSSKIKISLAELTKLRSACEVRSEAARQLFCQELTNMPECLVDKEGCSYHNDKSLLLKVIAPESTQVNCLSSEKADSLVVDLSVVMRSEAAVIKTSVTHMVVLQITYTPGRESCIFRSKEVGYRLRYLSEP